MRDSDKKRFRASLASKYPALGEQQLELLVPKAAPLVVTKLSPRDELITRGRDPLFFSHRASAAAGDPDPGALMPTCYALHLAPQALCRAVVVYPGLEKQVCRGADLFLPGVVRPAGEHGLDEAAAAARRPWPELLFGGPTIKGELCCLVSQARPWAPYAVGRIHRSTADFMITGLHGSVDYAAVAA